MTKKELQNLIDNVYYFKKGDLTVCDKDEWTKVVMAKFEYEYEHREKITKSGLDKKTL